MKLLNRFIFLTVVFCFLLPSSAQANKSKWLKAAQKAPSARLNRAVLKAAKRPDIRLSVARLDHACLTHYPMNKRPHSSAFLFQTEYNGKREVWAATASHVAQVGEKLILSFYDGKKHIPVTGTLVQQGPPLLSDAALIKLPDNLPPQLRPLTLATHINPQEPLTGWGYASNKLYHLDNLIFEKDNSRFIRTTFPEEQTKRSGLCGGPLLNPQGEVLGIHCGSSLEDKSYATNVRILPYLLSAYYGNNPDIPLLMHGHVLGSTHINERIYYIVCLDEHNHPLNTYNVYNQLHQSDVMNLLQDKEVRYMKFLLGQRYENKIERVLVYDTKTATYSFEDFVSFKQLYR